MCFVGHHLVHLLLVPVAGIRGDRFGELPDPRPFELVEGGGDHRGKLREVGRGVGDLRRQHDLLLVHGRLGVIALHEPEPGRDRLRIRVCDVHLPGRQLGRPIRLGPAARPPTQPVARGRPVVLVALVGAPLDVKL